MIPTFIKDKSIQSTIYILFDQIFNLLLSFIFWRIAVFYYDPDIIGIASSFLSITLWLSIVSRLGIDDTIRRFIPELSKEHQGNLIFTSVIFVIITSLIIGTIGILINLIFSSDKKISLFLIIILILLIIGLSVTPIVDSVLISKEKANFILIRSLITGTLRISLLILLSSFLVFGLLLSSTIPFYLAFLTLYVYVKHRNLDYSLYFKLNLIKKLAKYSLGIFSSSLIYYFPPAIFPFIILELVSPEQSAYFSIAWQLSRIIYIVPIAVNYVFVVEGSKNIGKGTRSAISKALLFGLFLLIPFYLTYMCLGPKILLFFGENYYLSGLFSFNLLIFTVFPSFFHYIYTIYCQISQNVISLLFINIIFTFSTFAIILLYIGEFGTKIVSIAWFWSNVLISLLIAFIFIYKVMKNRLQREVLARSI